ncbi:hypothetical protein D3C87_1217530 [compost metagenome]
MLDIATIHDSQTAEIIFTFNDGTIHTEEFELFGGDSLDALVEIDRILQIYASETGPRDHDMDSWYMRSSGTTEPQPYWDDDYVDYYVDAAETLTAIFDTYTSNKPRELVKFQTLMVDHLGNKLPLDIEYNI